MRYLYTVVREELNEGENIWITRQSKLDDMNDSEWWKFEEYSTREDVLEKYDRKDKVKRYWHEDGLCIILNK